MNVLIFVKFEVHKKYFILQIIYAKGKIVMIENQRNIIFNKSQVVYNLFHF